MEMPQHLMIRRFKEYFLVTLDKIVAVLLTVQTVH